MVGLVIMILVGFFIKNYERSEFLIRLLEVGVSIIPEADTCLKEKEKDKLKDKRIRAKKCCFL